MGALFVTVFLASLLGSAHCAGMCGAFVAFAVGLDPQDRARRVHLHAAYNGGRLVTYMTLGALAGLLGSFVELGGSLIGLQRGAAVAAGGAMIVFGTIALLRARGVKLPRVPVPKLLQHTVASGQKAAMGMSPVWRALTVGLLTTLLPCGWLYAFAITAAGTADPLLGALTMGAFWMGTLPIMVTIGAGVQAATGVVGRRLPLIMPAAIVCVGLFTVLSRPTFAAGLGTLADEGRVPPEQAAARVMSLPGEPMPCCNPE